jgi:hypothetical protein
MNLICAKEVRGNGNKLLRRHCGHKFCAECEMVSLPPRSSDYWICCQPKCGAQNLYYPEKHYAALKERSRRKGILHADDASIYDASIYNVV